MLINPFALIREIYNYAWYGSGWFLGTIVGSELFGISSLIGEDGVPLPHPKEREDASDPANIPDFGVMSVRELSFDLRVSRAVTDAIMHSLVWEIRPQERRKTGSKVS